MIESIKSSPVESIGVVSTAVRQTPEPPSQKFAQALKQGALVLLGAASGVASALPAGGFVSAALRGTAGAMASASSPPAGAMAGESPLAPGGSAVGALPSSSTGTTSEMDELLAIQQAGMESSLEVLKIQEAVSRESRVFTTLSNVLKARHDTASSAINNIR